MEPSAARDVRPHVQTLRPIIILAGVTLTIGCSTRTPVSTPPRIAPTLLTSPRIAPTQVTAPEPTEPSSDNEVPDLPVGWTPGTGPPPLPPPDPMHSVREAIRRGMRQRVNALARCSKHFFCRNTAIVTFTLAADLLGCVTGALARAPFVLPQTSVPRGTISVSYPLHYSCAGGD